MSLADLIDDLLVAEIRPDSPNLASAETRASTSLSPNSPHSPRDLGADRHWWIHFPKLAPVEALFSQAVTPDEALAAFPGAVAVERIPEIPKKPVTPEQADELRELVALIFADANDAERAEVFAVACADREAALATFRLLAADSPE